MRAAPVTSVTQPAVPHVELRAISKRYGGVQAVGDVHLRVARGRIHGLVGANGAGKSTLGKLICGAARPDTGTLLVDGQAMVLPSPRSALDLGLARISQEIAVVPARSVLDNVFLGLVPRRRGGWVDVAEMQRQYRTLSEQTGFTLPPDIPVRRLNLADQQRVEILRAVARKAELIVMDEPTAALTRAESVQLMSTITGLAASGTTIVLVSHFLEDVLAVTDTVTVMRDGHVVRSRATAGETMSSLVEGMLGAGAGVAYPQRRPVHRDAPIALRVSSLSGRTSPAEVSFDVRAGEILGISGLMGSGRSELLRTVFGADPRRSGVIEVAGRNVRIRSPREAVRHGMAMVPESRKLQGLHLTHSLRRNVSLPHLRDISVFGVVHGRAERDLSSGILSRLGVQPVDDTVPAFSLSGGNQQRVLFAKWLARRPTVLLADEPTRGVDVGGKSSIYEILTALAAEGVAVVFVSSEMEEVIGLAHRVLVMNSGRITAELLADEITEERLLLAGFGGVDTGATR